jgi:hypothetical protein
LLHFASVAANVERHQVEEGICSTLLEIVNSNLWPPTLRDLASGHLQFLMETHSNLLQIGQEWQTQRQAEQLRQQQQQTKSSTTGGRRSGSNAGIISSADAGSSRSPGKPCSASTAEGVAAAPSGSNPLPFNLAALLNPTAAAAGSPKGQKQQQQAPDPLAEAVAAAGSHVGLVPVVTSFVTLVKTGHPLLELSGARGIARYVLTSRCLCLPHELAGPTDVGHAGEPATC